MMHGHKSHNKSSLILHVKNLIYQDLSYGEILASRPGAWLVKKTCFICMQSKQFKKGTYVEIQNDFQNIFNFYDSL